MAEPGRLIGPYRLLSVLGRGATGEVWRARDERLDRMVALKLLPPGREHSEQQRARTLREAKASASIPHPNVVTLFDIISDGDDDILVMELVDGETLAERLKREGPIQAAEVVRIVARICDALVAAHQQGILHRDIKTANVMQTQTGRIKVLDFGLAKLRSDIQLQPVDETVEPDLAVRATERLEAQEVSESADQIALDQTMVSRDPRLDALSPTTGDQSDPLLITHAGQILGTPLYMAPEQFAGETPTERSEVFAVGVVGYELASGRPPFVGETYTELQTNVFTVEPPPLEDVDRELNALLLRALSKDPKDRFSSMTEMRAAIAALEVNPVKPTRRLWPMMALAAAVATLVVVLFMLRNNNGGGGGRGGSDADVPVTPSDRYVSQGLVEFNLFYNQKAAASLRAARRETPDHPLALAYSMLLPTESGAALDGLLAQANERIAEEEVPLDPRDRLLLAVAIELATRGPQRASEVLENRNDEVSDDAELAFWRAELAYRARDYRSAAVGFERALAWSEQDFRGRIYDHYSAVLLYFGDNERALEVGTMYAEAFSGEADAVGVYATTLASVGRLDDALAAAKEARRLYEGEDTVAGLAKIHAMRGEYKMARKLYQKSAAMAPESRRPIRLAAQAWLAWISGDDDNARDIVTPCLPGGDDDGIWQRGPCLWVAGLLDSTARDTAIKELERLSAAGTALRPAYGFPGNLAKLLRAQQLHFAGACWRPDLADSNPLSARDRSQRDRWLEEGSDFFARYHIPMFANYAECERKAVNSSSLPSSE